VLSIAASGLGPFEAFVLGLVEGLTEFLPVSSTGHLILAGPLLGLPAGSETVKSFDIVIQVGAILAVVGLYRRRMAMMLKGMAGKDDAGRRLLLNLVIAFLPAAVIGSMLYKTIKSHLFYPLPVAAALALGGVLMIAFDGVRARRVQSGVELDALTPKQALIIGFAQCFAMWPGTSRSLSTIVGGVAIGLKPAAAAEFSFLLALPTLSAATVLDLARDGRTLLESTGATPLIIGMLVAFVSAALAVRAFVAWLNHHGLIPFGIYRIVLAAAVLLFWPA